MSAVIQNEMERLRSERDALKQQLDEALEREAALAARLGRYSMCAGHAEQRRAESRAVRNALGFGEDDNDVSPQDLLNALNRRDLINQAEVLELAESAMTNEQDAATMRLNAANLRQRAQELT